MTEQDGNSEQWRITDWIEEHFESRPGRIKVGWKNHVTYPMCLDCLCFTDNYKTYNTFQDCVHKWINEMNARGYTTGGVDQNPTFYFVAEDDYERVLISYSRLQNVIGFMKAQDLKMQATKLHIPDFPTLSKEIGQAIDIRAIIDKHRKLLEKKRDEKTNEYE
jgi:hypothetical protein